MKASTAMQHGCRMRCGASLTMTRHRAFLCKSPKHHGLHQVCASDAHRQGARTSEHSDSSFPPLSLVLSLLPGVDVGEPQTTNEKRPPRPLTAYSVRLHTGHGRGAALSEPLSGVNICLIGHDGRAVLHQISPVNDPEAALACFDRVCQVVDASVGVDCHTIKSVPAAGSAATSPSAEVFLTKTPRTPQPRFLQGRVDEVMFLAPELGPLAGVLVGIEQGTWMLDEMTVSSSRTQHVDRFVCRRLLGGQPGLGAAFLTPVPLKRIKRDATKKDQTATVSVEEDEGRKKQALYNTAVLTAGGSLVAGLVAGLHGALSFFLGGTAGLVYHWLLQQGVDAEGAEKNPSWSAMSMGQAAQGEFSSTRTDRREGSAAEQPGYAHAGAGGNTAAFTMENPGKPLVSSLAARLALMWAVTTAMAVKMLGVTAEQGSHMAAIPLSHNSSGQLVMWLLGFLVSFQARPRARPHVAQAH
mmetsp:Transcript_15456/g.26744  ORF Transcript_15456/g.26744 Transcript_15456/m.26744 type:complete len:469 (+) Transcript_15456:12-1418(+)